MTNIDKYLLYIISAVLFINLGITLSENIEISSSLLVICIIITATIIYNELFIINEDVKSFKFWICIFTIFTLTTYLSKLGIRTGVRIYYCIIIYQSYKKLKHLYVHILFIGILAIDIYCQYHSETIVSKIIKKAAFELLIFLLVYIIIILIFYIIEQNKRLNEMSKALTLKNCKLEYTHRDLIKAYNKLEKYTIIKERQNIAREMHDSVGHTLTTALVELEVSNLLIQKNPENSSQKLENAISQVRKALFELRTSVKSLKNEVDYIAEINELILNTEKHTGIAVKTYMDNVKKVNIDILSCVYRILQEGLTNGIKHGQSTAFIFRINFVHIEKKMFLNLYLQDNGVGTTIFNKGFGINAMEERVKELKGDIRFEYNSHEGFGIYAQIPL